MIARFLRVSPALSNCCNFSIFSRSLFASTCRYREEMVVEKEDLERLEKKAKQAEDLIIFLKEQLKHLEQRDQSNKSFAHSADIQQLKSENDRLRNEASQLKKDLETLEVQNGATLVPLPSKNQSTPQEAPAPASAAPVKAASEPAQKENEEEKNTENGKAEKGKKKDKGGKGKEKAAAPAAEEPAVDVSRLDMRIGQILSVKRHPDADTLYVEEVDVGESQTRTVVTGVVAHIPIEQMQDRLVIALCNLKPAKMRGILSQGMLMCASTPEKVELLDPPAGSEIGDVIYFEGYSGPPDVQLNPKKKIFEKIQPDFLVNENMEATWRGVPFKIKGKEGLCKSQTLKGVGIK